MPFHCSTDPGPTSESESARPPRRSVSVSRTSLSHHVLGPSFACALARLGGPCRRIPAQDSASQLRLGSGGGRLGSRSVVSELELEQAVGRRLARRLPAFRRCQRRRAWPMAGSVPSVQASTDGRLRVHLCPWPTRTHTHGAGSNGEAHPWGAVGVGPRLKPVPGATERLSPSRHGQSSRRRRPGGVCLLPCGPRRSGASSSCRAPARPRRHALSRAWQGPLSGL